MSQAVPARAPLEAPVGLRLLQERPWPIWAAFVLFPLWWVAGISAFIWPIVGFAAAVSLVRSRPVRMPVGFGWWMLFLVWVVLSITQADAVDRVAAGVFRASQYGAATALFLWVYNREASPRTDTAIIRAVSWLWVWTAIGGVVAVFLPRASFPSLLKLVLPESLLSIDFINQLVSPQIAQVSTILGVPIGRPEAPFAFTNAWGSTYALLLPFVVVLWIAWPRSQWTATTRLLAGLSIVPIVFSLNRGMWLSLVAGLSWVAVRFFVRGRAGPLVGMAAAALVVGGALALSPLGSVVEGRAERGHSDEGRLSLYAQAIDLARDAPVLGYGAPQPPASGTGPSVGTHGQFWLVLVSQGIPGLVLFLGWFGLGVWRTRWVQDDQGIWLHSVFIMAGLQLFFYELLPGQLQILMITLALLLRRLDRPLRARPTERAT